MGAVGGCASRFAWNQLFLIGFIMTRLGNADSPGGHAGPLGNGLTEADIVGLANPAMRIQALIPLVAAVGRPPILEAVDRAASAIKTVVPHLPAEMQPNVAVFLPPIVDAYACLNRSEQAAEVAKFGVGLFAGGLDVVPLQLQVVCMALQFELAKARADMGQWPEAEEGFRAALDVIDAMPDQGQAACIGALFDQWEQLLLAHSAPPEFFASCLEIREQAYSRQTAANDVGDLSQPHILEDVFQQEIGRFERLPIATAATRLVASARQFWRTGNSVPLAERLARHVFEDDAFAAAPQARERLAFLWVADGLRQTGEDEAGMRIHRAETLGVRLEAFSQAVGQCLQASNEAISNGDPEKALTDARVALIIVRELFPDQQQAYVAALRTLATAECFSNDLDAGIEHLRSALRMCPEVDQRQLGSIEQQLADTLFLANRETLDPAALDEADDLAGKAIGRLFMELDLRIPVALAYRTRVEIARARGEAERERELRSEVDSAGVDPLPPRSF